MIATAGVQEVGPGWGARSRMGMVALAMCGVLAGGCDRGAHPARIGKRPRRSFKVSDGAKSMDLGKLRGRVVVLNFWATSCIPCVDELPSLEMLQRRMPEVVVVGISNDDDDVAAAYGDFCGTYHVDFLTVRDPSFHSPTMYGTVKMPETYVIDRRGVLRRKFVSAQEWTDPEIMDYLGRM